MIEDKTKPFKEDEENEEANDGEESPEKLEEKKLMSKFPQGVKGPPQSQFLQKRLQQRKFFDSGDYNMAKAKGLKLPVNSSQKQQQPAAVAAPQPSTLLVTVVDQPEGSTSPTGCEIPTPNTIPLRKTSIVQTTASKLSPQPLLHHSPTGGNPLATLDASV